MQLHNDKISMSQLLWQVKVAVQEGLVPTSVPKLTGFVVLQMG